MLDNLEEGNPVLAAGGHRVAQMVVGVEHTVVVVHMVVAVPHMAAGVAHEVDNLSYYKGINCRDVCNKLGFRVEGSVEVDLCMFLSPVPVKHASFNWHFTELSNKGIYIVFWSLHGINTCTDSKV